MRIVSPRPPRINADRAISVMLDVIAAALNADGASVEPNDIDSAGLTVVIDGMSYRLDVAEPVLLDDADWRGRLDRREYSEFLREDERCRRIAGDGYDARDAFIGEVDPAGFNGMVAADDIEF